MHIRRAELRDVPGIAHVHVESWRSTYAGVINAETLANLSTEQRETQWRNALTTHATQNDVFVAEDAASRIIGFASGGAERGEIDSYDGELYAIYLLELAQGKGVGRRLMFEIAQCLRNRNFEKMAVWVLADNPSRGFYEALGGEYINKKSFVINEQPLVEVAYGYTLSTLLKR